MDTTRGHDHEGSRTGEENSGGTAAGCSLVLYPYTAFVISNSNFQAISAVDITASEGLLNDA